MNMEVLSAETCFRRIYLDGIPVLLERNETSFLAFVCMLAATDALSGYRYLEIGGGGRFCSFVRDYYPSQYHPHADRLYRFRCRMLHNLSPAHFTLVHQSPELHLQVSQIGDLHLDDSSLFCDFAGAAELFFSQLRADATMQAAMASRLADLDRGGAIWVSGNSE